MENQMISRQWVGIAKESAAGRYVAHLQDETFPALAKIPGFIDASILRRNVAAGVEFRIVTLWKSIDAIRQFAGVNAERAVVPENVRAMMVKYDDVVAHYEVV
jgi:heme-degrading monooxygenase HmoA